MIPLLAMVNNLIFVGMTAAQILNFIGKKTKGLEKGINQARSTGYNDDDILKFISGKMPKGNSKEAHQALSDQEQYLKNAGLKTRQEKQESKRKGISTALNIGATALVGYRLYKAYASRFPKMEWDFTRRPMPEKTLQLEGQSQKQLPYNPGLEKGPIGPNQFQMVPQGNPIKPQSIGPITNPNQPIQPPQNLIHQAKQPNQNIPVPLPNQPIQPPLPVPDPKAILDQMGLTEKIDNLINAGNSPEQAAAGTLFSLTPGQKDWIKKNNIPIEELISQYFQQGKANGTQLAGNQPQNQIQLSSEGPIAQEGANPLENQNVIEGQNRQAPEETKKENGDVVQLPDGEIGTIESIKKDHAVVDIDGKKRPVKLDQIEDIPIKKKDLADLHEDLIKGIEEEIGSDVSRNVNWAGYDPKTNRLSYLPHDGALYVYDDIDPEDAKLLTNILSTRKSSGGNFIGPWIAGTKSPIGAAMSALIKRLQGQRGGKGNEYSGKFETIYSHLEPAIKAAKARKKKKK